MEKKIKKKTGFARLLELSGQKKTLMIWCWIFSSVSVVFQLFPYLAVYQVMAELLKNASDISAINRDFMITWAFRGLIGMLCGYLCNYIGGMLGHTAAYKILYGIRVRVTDHIGKLPLGWFNQNSTGKIKQIVEADVEQIEMFLAHQLPDLFNTVVLLLVMIVVMFQLNLWMALASVVPIIVGFVIQFSQMFGKKAQESLVKYYDVMENINTSSIQYVRGMPSIKIFGQTVRSFRKFYDDIINYRDFTTQYADNFEPAYAKFRVLVLSLATFILPVGLFLLSGNPDNMAFAILLIFFLVFAPGVSAPVFKLINMASTMSSITEGVKRIDMVLSEPAMKEPIEDKKPKDFNITFKNVTFAYNEEKEVLKNVDFVARQGKITALVGPSGSGKSTIAQLIPRFWDVTTGEIKIGEVDIRTIKNERLMDMMAFVFQDSFLLSDSLYNNIAIGKPNATKEEVYLAAKAAQCHDFIEKLPMGYETLIGEGGVYLSGGEEQRVAVARAILKNSPILILDEATAYADPENEYQMQLALQELIKNKTVIMIAHRLMTIKNADQIIVINAGEIEERGTHLQLLEKGGLYWRMWNTSIISSGWKLSKHSERKRGIAL